MGVQGGWNGMGSLSSPGRGRGPGLFLGSALLLLTAACGAEHPQSTVGTVTDLGERVESLYRLVFLWTLVILAVVWGVLAFVLVRYRERPGREPGRTRGHLPLEIAWTVAPALVVALISVPSVRTVFRTQGEVPDGEALVVEVVGHRWWWEFRYPQEGVVTANELHLPVGRPVTLELRSADVIHSFWVPRFGGKRDVNPVVATAEGERPRFTRLSFTVRQPGVYMGQCAEFCGEAHALMGLRVVAEAPEAFQAWIRKMRTPAAPEPGTPEAEGEAIFMGSSCVVCHAIQGTRARGVVGPNLTRFGARRTLGAGVLENTPENLIRWIRAPGDVKPGVLMPGAHVAAGGMPPTGLGDREIQRVAAYLLSLR